MRLAFCLNWAEFWDMWLSCWSNWSEHAKRWLTTASTHDKWLCATLRTPLSLVDSFTQRERHKFRTMVGLFQCRAI